MTEPHRLGNSGMPHFLHLGLPNEHPEQAASLCAVLEIAFRALENKHWGGTWVALGGTGGALRQWAH